MSVRKNILQGIVELTPTINKIQDILFEEIGIADIDFVVSSIIDNIDTSIIIEKIPNIKKSKLCLYITSLFYHVITDEFNIEYEPFPINQEYLINFTQNTTQSYDLVKALKIVGAMYYKQINNFWNLIFDQPFREQINKKYKIDSFIEKIKKRKNPAIWAFCFLWKYIFIFEKLDIKNNSYKEEFQKYSKIYLLPNYKYSDYFYIGKNEIMTNIPEGLKISNSDKNNYCIKKIEKEIQQAKYSLQEIIEFSSASITKKLHLSDLGVLQMDEFGIIYCWINNKRYSLKPFKVKKIAQSTNEANNLINKYQYQYPYTLNSHVIYISEILESGQVIDKKHYYLIKEEIYFLKINSITESKVVNHIYLINLLKYIFGISYRNTESLGLYFSNQEIKVYVDKIGPIFDDLTSFDKFDFEKYKLEIKWLSNQQFDKKFYVRFAEIISI